MTFRNLLVALFPFTLALAHAHPGHGLLEHGAGHVASSVYHLIALCAVAAGTLIIAQVVRNPSAKRYLRAAGATALIAAGALWGFGI